MKNLNVLVGILLAANLAAGGEVDPRDAAREALVGEIGRGVSAAVQPLEALRAKARASAPDRAKVRTGTWREVWPAGAGMVTNMVTGEIWNDAIQAAIDARGAVFVPAREKPYYLDAPITLGSGQALVADPKAEFRLVPGVNMCLVRNRSVVGMDATTLEIPAVPYDRGVYVEGGVWTSLKTAPREANGNFTGRVSKTKPVAGCYGAMVFNHVDGLAVKNVTIRQCNMHAIQLSDAHHFQVDSVTFDRQGRDGVHLHGRTDWGVIWHVTGDTGDDFIALNAWDWCHTSPTVGPIHHILVEDCACVYAPKRDRPEGCGAIRLQPGNRVRKDGRGTLACPVEHVVFRRLANVRVFKMYDQPNLERGRANDFSDPIGTMRDIYFQHLVYDRPGAFEIADNVDGCDISRVRFRWNAIGSDFVLVQPKSGTWKHGADPSKWVEIYSPDADFTVKNFSLRNVSICSDGLENALDPKAFVKVANGKLNPDYPKTTPRGGTGKVTFEWYPNVVDSPEKMAGDMPLEASVKKMETKVDPAVWTAWKKAHPAPFWLFGEERRLPVRMDMVPAHWFADGKGPAASFAGEAEPGEDFVFQVCVASETARSLTWENVCDAPGEDVARRITPAAVTVAADGLKPLWAYLRVAPDGRGRTVTGRVIVTDTATKASRAFPWRITVKAGKPIAHGGADDAWRMARLAWLDSDVGASLDAPTRPFTAIRVDEAARTLGILGRELVLGENGLPAHYRSFYNGSCTRILKTPTEFLAAPMTFGPEGRHAFRFTERYPCRVSWEGVTTATNGLRVRVEGTLEFDGFCAFRMYVEPPAGTDGTTCDPRLAISVPRALARFQMGLGRPGGFFPEKLDWKWDVKNQQDATWFGSPEAGMMIRLKGANYVRPLCNIYYAWRPLNLPPSWGGGGIAIRTDGVQASLEAWGGPVRTTAAKPMMYGFDLYLTPFKPVNLKDHLADRIHHFGQRNAKVDFPQLARDGVTIATFHHNTVWNPYINYPYNDDGGPLLKQAVRDAHASGVRLKVYYTTRELTQNLPEFFALRSLGDEVFFHCPADRPGRTCINPGGPHPWLAEHVGMDILPAWRENVKFAAYPSKPDLAVITQPDTRWNNYYLKGLEMLVRDYGIDGLYIDDTALDRASMQRARRILDEDGNTGRRIDMHSWNHASGAAGKGNSPIVFLELYPYYDLVWHGEGFKADTPAEFWLVERSGVPFGLLGQYLGKGNPFKCLVFAQTDRRGWGGRPEPMWKFFDDVKLGDAELIGWWDAACPVKVRGEGVKATVFRLPDGRLVVAVCNFARTACTVTFDASSVGAVTAACPAIDGLQKAAPYDLTVPHAFKPDEGVVLILTPAAGAFNDLVPKPRAVAARAGTASAAACKRVRAVKGPVPGAPEDLAAEGYVLEVAPDGVTITASDPRGERYARTTLAQLVKLSKGSVPCCRIVDWPALRWRGFMNDCGRNYLDFSAVKAIVDVMAQYKMNLFHWHLADYHGWRLESKKYPQLQRKEAFLRQVGKYYTQDEFRELVAYAAARGVTVMPELDVPGHTLALRRGLGIETMAAPGTDRIVADLFAELCSLAPADVMPFIHLGTDEVRVKPEFCPDAWVSRWARTVNRLGRRAVVWAPGKKLDADVDSVAMAWYDQYITNTTRQAFDSARMYNGSWNPFMVAPHAAFTKACRWESAGKRQLGAITCTWHDDNCGDDNTRLFRDAMVFPSIVAFADNYWHGRDADHAECWNRVPAPGTPLYALLDDLERRLAAQRDAVFASFPYPFPFLRQTQQRWRLTDTATGKVLASDVPQGWLEINGTKDSPGLADNLKAGSVTAETWISSPADQNVGAWIDFTCFGSAYGRTSPTPDRGEWNKHGAKVYLNGVEIPPPAWVQPNMKATTKRICDQDVPWTDDLLDKPFADEGCARREPTPIHLKKGWNHVRLVMPKRPGGSRWVGLFAPLLGTSAHPREVPGLVCSDAPNGGSHM